MPDEQHLPTIDLDINAMGSGKFKINGQDMANCIQSAIISIRAGKPVKVILKIPPSLIKGNLNNVILTILKDATHDHP